MSEPMPVTSPTAPRRLHEGVKILLGVLAGSGLTVGGAAIIPAPPAPPVAEEIFTFTPAQLAAYRQTWTDAGRAEALREIADALTFDRIDQTRTTLHHLGNNP